MSQHGAPLGQLRVIGGQWRGRRLNFPALPGLRPTPDRVRETLFNWLAPVVSGVRCLDLFAGSGALGIEALSRGAAEVYFVEQHPQAARALSANLRLLAVQAQRAHLEMADALQWLRQPGVPFEIVLLDPPFAQNLLAPVCAALEQGGWLNVNASAWIYMETAAGTETEFDAPCWPATWQLWRDKTAGAVRYRLVRRVNTAASCPTDSQLP